jgi:hypothetical protein
MWRRTRRDAHGGGEGEPNDQDYLYWSLALDFCDKLSFAGHDDWRLPNVRELQSIIDYGRVEPSIDPVFGTLKTLYWTSTTYAGNDATAWTADFFIGQLTPVAKDSTYFVRAVRNAP